MQTSLVTIALATFLIGGPAEAGQSEGVDRHWLPWLGCWQLSEEEFQSPDGTAPLELESREVRERTSVCLTMNGPEVKMTVSEGDQLLVERAIAANGTRRDIVENECRGWEENRWSRDGHRLFTKSEIRCDDMATRILSGISFLTSTSKVYGGRLTPFEETAIWVDVQFVKMGSHQQLEVRRYNPAKSNTEGDLGAAPGTAAIKSSDISQARRESAEPPDMADVMEANRSTAVRAVEALLVETEPKLNLNSKALVGLDDAGLDHDIIDLLVAQSFPDRFVIERRGRRGTWSSRQTGNFRGFGGFGGFYDPVWYSDLYPYYITPLGFSRYWGGRYNPYFYGSTVMSPFIIIPNMQGSARAVNGSGYTRVRPRTVDPQRPVGRPGTTATSGGGSTRTGSSDGATASPSGFSGGQSGTRRAVPRR